MPTEPSAVAPGQTSIAAHNDELDPALPRSVLCFAMLQLLASEHSCVVKQESLLRLDHICSIVSTQ
nr:hypothetical protein [uncultured bacterium]